MTFPPLNIELKSLTMDMFHNPKLRLKEEAPSNMDDISVTLDVVHVDTSPLNDEVL